MSKLYDALMSIRNTLDCITVNGKNNCGMIYGCIDAIDKAINDINTGKVDIIEDEDVQSSMSEE